MNIWDLPPEALEEARKHYTEEQVQALVAARKANYNAFRVAVLEAHGGVSEEEFATYYQDRFGIEHTCKCADDHFLNRYTRSTDCTADLHNKLLEKLEEVLPERDYLAAEVARLRQRVIELGGSYDENE